MCVIRYGLKLDHPSGDMGTMICKTTGTYIGKCWLSFFIVLRNAWLCVLALYHLRPHLKKIILSPFLDFFSVPCKHVWITFFLRSTFQKTFKLLVFFFCLPEDSMTNFTIFCAALILLFSFLALRTPHT